MNIHEYYCINQPIIIIILAAMQSHYHLPMYSFTCTKGSHHHVIGCKVLALDAQVMTVGPPQRIVAHSTILITYREVMNE